jgi:hypothetical protein
MALLGTGRIRAGEMDRFDVILSANVTYTVYVRPDRGNVDLDLHVYDENGRLVEWDETPASDAACYVTPRWTGPFYIMVLCARGASTYKLLVD